MTLSEAVQVCRLMSREASNATRGDAQADQMLRSVCRWRSTTPARFEELARLLTIGCPTGAGERGLGIDRPGACIERALNGGGHWTRSDLASECHCRVGNVATIVSRLRGQGVPITTTRDEPPVYYIDKIQRRPAPATLTPIGF